MASMGVIRVFGGCSLSRLLGSQMLHKSAPLGAMMVPKKTFMLTTQTHKRLYGPDASTHSDTPMWRNEKLLALAMIPIIPGAIMFPSAPMDYLLSTALVMHCHWRLSGVFEDYIHGELLPKIHQPMVLIFSILAFGGLCYLNYSDIGLCNAIRLLYTEL